MGATNGKSSKEAPESTKIKRPQAGAREKKNDVSADNAVLKNEPGTKLNEDIENIVNEDKTNE